tara:strand:+ start:856 stop:1089 length:234 start_codon:yes stop_codon:yes gene_type:complete
MSDSKSNIILEIKNIEKKFEKQIGETTIESIMRIMIKMIQKEHLQRLDPLTFEESLKLDYLATIEAFNNFKQTSDEI